MEKPESLKEFYKRKFNRLPEDLKNDLGHFNFFQPKPNVEGLLKSLPYRRKDFFKIILVQGGARVHSADSVYEVKMYLNQFPKQFRKGL
jgi:AraC family transcriptional regulator, transcriptional activator of pobA